MQQGQQILVDTGAWVDFLGSPDGELGSKVALAIEYEQAAICGVIITELLQGSGHDQQDKLNFLFSQIKSLPLSESAMTHAGQMLQQQRKLGRILPLTDAVIAAVAIEHDAALLTADANFGYFPGLRLVTY